MTTYPHPACMEPDGGEGPCRGYVALQEDRERLHRALSAIMVWHANWDAEFHGEDEWRGDKQIALAALRGEDAKL